MTLLYKTEANVANTDINNNNKNIIDADVERIPATMDISNKILQDGKNDLATTSIAMEIDEDNLETVQQAPAATNVVKINLETINCNVFEKIDMFAESQEVASYMASTVNTDVDETLSLKTVCMETSNDMVESLNDSFVTAKCMETHYDSMESLNSSSLENESDDSVLVSGQHTTTKSPKTNNSGPKYDDKRIIFDNRSECEVFIKRLCAQSGCEEFKVIAELLNFPDPDEIDETEGARANTIVETNAIHLLYLICSATLADAGIVPGNARYYCFMDVLKNYIKIHAAKKFIEKMETVTPIPLLKTEDEMKLMPEVADELLKVSQLYQKLCKSLENMDFLYEISAYKVFLEVRPQLTSGVLCGLMLDRVSRVFLCVVSSQSFLQLTDHEVVHLIQSSYLSVNSEIEILLSVILWLEHTWFRRKYQAEYVLSVVRFNLLPLWYFATMERANKCYHFARIIKMPFVRQMLEKGFEEAQILRAKADGSLPIKQISVPMPRDWVADPATPHHHKQHCKHFEYPTIDVFKKYLKNTISNVPDYWRLLRPAEEVYRSTLQCCAHLSFE